MLKIYKKKKKDQKQTCELLEITLKKLNNNNIKKVSQFSPSSYLQSEGHVHNSFIPRLALPNT